MDDKVQEVVNQVQKWLAKCENDPTHSQCKRPPAGDYPNRLIMIHPQTHHARLIETPYPAPSYIALSYVWGDPKFNLKTTDDNIAERREGIPRNKLPKTLSDVFALVIALGETYLWVDALCIIQGNARDWKHESRKMGSIYSNASLVLSAMASKGVTDGLFFEPSPYWSQHVDEFHQIMRTCRTMSKKDWGRIVYDFPLLCRGWAFQERLLAQRVVHFTAFELVWECKEDRWCGCGDAIKDLTVNQKINNMSSAFQACLIGPADEKKFRPMWRECVTSYSKRELSESTDRLTALSGVARLLRGPNFKKEFLEGLWDDALPFDLLWYCDQTSELTHKRLDTPSWSWTSVMCGIEWPKKERKPDDEALHYISSSTYFEKDLEPVKCSREINGEITLTTRMISVYFEQDYGQHCGWIFREPNPSVDWQLFTSINNTLSFYPDIPLQAGEYQFLEIFKPGAEPEVWQIGLIVRRCNDGEKYERVGLAGDVSCDPGRYASCWFEGGTEQDIVLCVSQDQDKPASVELPDLDESSAHRHKRRRCAT